MADKPRPGDDTSHVDSPNSTEEAIEEMIDLSSSSMGLSASDRGTIPPPATKQTAAFYEGDDNFKAFSDPPGYH